jgi:hypothetical protein
MIGFAVAASLAAQPVCPAADLRAELLSLHETTRRAHLLGDAALIAGTTADRLLLADSGAVRLQSKAELTQFFTGYFKRVRYRQWRDASPPVVTISPDGQMAWMAVEVEAQYTQTDKPAEGEKTFRSSWIATYQRDKCAWRMTGMASNVVG